MELLKELATALSKAQGEMKGAIKDSANPFFKSKYADLSSVVEAIREPLAKHGLSYVQLVREHENAASVETMILHSSGEWLLCGPVSVPVTKADAQGFGSAMTYARRYSLSAAFGVAPEDDDGNAAAKAVPKKEESAGKAVEQEIALEGMTPEVSKAIRNEALKIGVDFYQVGVKAALGSYRAFEKDAGDGELEALWALLDSKVRSGIKKALDAGIVA